MENVWKPNVEISPNCPRCGSSNTKFCYYNNYSLTQPRYFCKGCRRYWTKGGSLRNVPVGGGCRKNRRSSNNNKALRQSIDGGNFKNSSPNCGGDVTTNHNQIIGHHHSYDPRRTNNNSSSSSSTSAMADGPSIDLALVYANFLNQKPDSLSDGVVVVENNSEYHQIQQVFDPSIENSSRLSNIKGGGPISTNLHEEQFGLISDCLNLPQQQQQQPLSTIEHNFGEGNNNSNNDQMYLSDQFNSMQVHHHHQKAINNNRIIIEQCSSHAHDDDNSNNNINFELPPLPSCDEEESHDLLWSNNPNDHIMVNHHDLHQATTTQPQPLFGSDEMVHHDDDDDAELLIGNWSPFDLPRDASFSRP